MILLLSKNIITSILNELNIKVMRKTQVVPSASVFDRSAEIAKF